MPTISNGTGIVTNPITLYKKYDFARADEDYLWYHAYGTRCLVAIASNVLQLLYFFKKIQIENHFLKTRSTHALHC